MVLVHCWVTKFGQLKSLVVPYNTHCVSNYIWIVRCLYFWSTPLCLPLLLFEQGQPPDFFCMRYQFSSPHLIVADEAWYILAKRHPMHVCNWLCITINEATSKPTLNQKDVVRWLFMPPSSTKMTCNLVPGILQKQGLVYMHALFPWSWLTLGAHAQWGLQYLRCLPLP